MRESNRVSDIEDIESKLEELKIKVESLAGKLSSPELIDIERAVGELSETCRYLSSYMRLVFLGYKLLSKKELKSVSSLFSELESEIRESLNLEEVNLFLRTYDRYKVRRRKFKLALFEILTRLKEGKADVRLISTDGNLIPTVLTIGTDSDTWYVPIFRGGLISAVETLRSDTSKVITYITKGNVVAILKLRGRIEFDPYIESYISRVVFLLVNFSEVLSQRRKLRSVKRYTLKLQNRRFQCISRLVRVISAKRIPPEDLTFKDARNKLWRSMIRELKRLTGARYILLGILHKREGVTMRDMDMVSDLPQSYLKLLYDRYSDKPVPLISKACFSDNHLAQGITAFTLRDMDVRSAGDIEAFKLWQRMRVKELVSFLAPELRFGSLAIMYYLPKYSNSELRRFLKLISVILFQALEAYEYGRFLQVQMSALERLQRVLSRIKVGTELKDYLEYILEALHTAHPFITHSTLILKLRNKKLVLHSGEEISTDLQTELEAKLDRIQESFNSGEFKVLTLSNSFNLYSYKLQVDGGYIAFGLLIDESQLASTCKLNLPLVIRLLILTFELLLRYKITYERLHETYHQLSELFNAVPDPIILFDIGKDEIVANRQAIDVFQEANLKIVAKEVLETYYERRESFEWNYDSRTYYVSVRMVPYLSKCIITFSDITLLKRTHQESLFHAKIALLGNIVSGLAHELNNPLQIAVGYVQMIDETRLPSEYREHFRIVKSALDNMSSIMRRLTSFVKYQNYQPLEKIPVNPYIQEIIGLIRTHYEKHGINVRLTLDDKLPLVKVNISDLQNIVLNLVQNSFEAIVDSGVGDTIEVKSFYDKESNKLVITVEDNGPGIPQELNDKIYDTFFSTKLERKSAGLGLSLVKTIVSNYNGSIEHLSKPGHTVFTVKIPIE